MVARARNLGEWRADWHDDGCSDPQPGSMIGYPLGMVSSRHRDDAHTPLLRAKAKQLVKRTTFLEARRKLKILKFEEEFAPSEARQRTTWQARRVHDVIRESLCGLLDVRERGLDLIHGLVRYRGSIRTVASWKPKRLPFGRIVRPGPDHHLCDRTRGWRGPWPVSRCKHAGRAMPFKTAQGDQAAVSREKYFGAAGGWRRGWRGSALSLLCDEYRRTMVLVGVRLERRHVGSAQAWTCKAPPADLALHAPGSRQFHGEWRRKRPDIQLQPSQ
jgi:hypothetical protein